MKIWSIATAILLGLSGVAIAQTSTPSPEPVEVFRGSKTNGNSSVRSKRSLRLTVTVNSPEHLKVKEGEEIDKGEIIADNSLERERLRRQRKSVVLQINNLRSKSIPKPFQPKPPPKLAPLPAANFLEQEAAIAQTQLKLQQAASRLKSRTEVLKYDNPQVRAEAEEAEAALRNATEKVQEQEELIRTMKDMKLDNSVLRHEQAKLVQLQGEQEQKRSLLDQAQAKINFAAIEQQQELQQLQIAVQLAESQLQVVQSRLESAKNQRKLLEYKASLDSAQRIERENQSKLSYSQQRQRYAQALRDRDYQLAQLQLALTAVEDKIGQIPVVRSPRDGYIRRVKPWVGNNGRYTTTITISSVPKSRN